MKIRRLYLKAFGPFTERWLDFSDNMGMTIIYGKNEAGKTSTLRALHSFLFGIDHNSPDRFVHEYPQLRVGAVLEDADGQIHGLMRRKGNKKTLFAMNPNTGEELTDQPVEEQFLSGLLGGLDSNLYRALFGLDLLNLVEGSAELLSGQGEIGASLFQATAGLGNLQSLSGTLASEAAELFKGGGSVPVLNKALKDIDEKRAKVKDGGVKTTVWQAKAKAVDEAEKAYQDVVAQLEQLVREQEKLSQVAACLPLTAERTERLARLDMLKDVPHLSPDAAEQRIKAQEALRNAETARAKATGEIELLTALLDSLQVNQAILDQSAPIEALYHRVTSWREGQRRVPELNKDINKVKDDITQALQRMGLPPDGNDPRQLDPPPTLVARINTLIGRHQSLQASAEALNKQARTANAAMAKAQQELDRLPGVVSVTAMAAIRDDIVGRGDLEKSVADTQRQFDEAQLKVEQGAAALWAGSYEDLSRLRLPTVASLDEFQAQFALSDQALRELDTADAKVEQDLQDVEQERAALVVHGVVVTLDQVLAARERRDVGWQLIQQAYVQRTHDPEQLAGEYAAGSGTLPAAFEASIDVADQLVDRRCQEAERTTAYELACQRIDQMRRALDQSARQRETLSVQRQGLQLEWETEVAGLSQPRLTPAAAKEWCQRQRIWLESFLGLGPLKAEAQVAKNEASRARKELAQIMNEVGLAPLLDSERLGAALNRARQYILQVTETSQTRAILQATLQREQEAKQTSDQELNALMAQTETLLGQWREAATALRLPPDAGPDEARARLVEFEQLRAMSQKLQALADNVTVQSDLVRAFEVDAKALVDLLRQEGSLTSDIGAQVESLYITLAKQRDDANRRAQAEANLLREQGNQREAERMLGAQREVLAALMAAAKANDAAELPEIEARAVEKQQAERRVQELGRQLATASTLPLEQTLEFVADFDIVSVRTRQQSLQLDRSQLDDDRDKTRQALVEARRELGLIDGGDVAAEAQEDLEAALAKTSRGIRDYLRLKLSQTVITNVVNAYKDKHQGPVMTRAGEIFKDMTSPSFEKLVTDFEGDSQVLLGQRPDGSRVDVKGLSTGTRDQLFLSLRLAGIEEHLKTREAIPLVIDDLLVQFDNGRARAALKQLAGLSEKTQVIFFTHHEHMLELADSGPASPAWQRVDL